MAAKPKPSEVNVDAAMTFAADQFEVAFNDAKVFADRDRFDTVEIDQGVLDLDLERTVTTGRIDEVELHNVVDPDGGEQMVSVVRGRDKASLSIDSTIWIVYSTSTNPIPAPSPLAQVGMPPIPIIPGVTVPILLPGPWTAQRICVDLAARVGLGCVYQAPDYHLREDVVSSGPVLSTIQTLLAPFSQFEAYKVDFWVEKDVLIVRQRPGVKGGIPGGPVIGPAGTISAHDARISNIMIRLSYLGYIRVVRITGAAGTSVADNQNPSQPAAPVDPGDETIVTSETMEKGGVTLSTIVTTEVRRRLDRATLSKQVDTYLDNAVDVTVPAVLLEGDALSGGFIETSVPTTAVSHSLRLVETATTTVFWDPLVLRYPGRVVNKPKNNGQVTVISVLDVDTGLFQEKVRITVENSWDAGGFLTATTTVKESLQVEENPELVTLSSFQWKVVSTEVKQYRVNGAQMYEIVTTTYDADGVAQGSRTTTANGTPPGGPGRSLPQQGSSDTVGTGIAAPPLVLVEVISRLKGAKDFALQNRNLLLPHMRQIAAQARSVSGASEFEVSFTAVGIPWLRRGMFVLLTDFLEADDVTPIEMSAALVTEVKMAYRESSPEPTYAASVKALWWEFGFPEGPTL